jgi:hypothetical protein
MVDKKRDVKIRLECEVLLTLNKIYKTIEFRICFEIRKERK